MSDDREAAEGRVRRALPLLAGAIGLVLVAALTLAGGRLFDEEPRSDGAGAVPSGSPSVGGEASPALHGRLVYLAESGRRDGAGRLWIVDLGGGIAARGPAVPAVDDLVAAGPGRRRIVLVGTDGDERVAYLLPDLATSTEPVEIARGDLIAPSADGSELVVIDAGVAVDPACGEPVYRLRRIVVRTGRDAPAAIRPPCGMPLSVGSVGDRVVVSLRRGAGSSRVVTVPSRGEPTTLFRRLAHVAVSPEGSILFVRPSLHPAADPLPSPPAGPLLYWPGGGTPRPVVTGRGLVAHRILAWSPFGRYLVVDGVIEGERTLWRIDVAAGTAAWLLPAGAAPADPGSVGATFDDGGTAFGAVPGGIVAQLPSSASVDVLPDRAPAPVGPIAWLP